MTEIKISKQDSMVEISQTLMGERESILLTAGDIQAVVVWLKKNRPDTTRDIFCGDCPQHICRNYHGNESERGHKNR